MIIENAAIEYAFHQIARDLNEESPQLSLVFIFHQKGEELTALKSREEAITELPGGQALVKILYERKNFEPTLLKTTSRPFPFLIEKHSFLGVCFINLAELSKGYEPLFDTEEDVQKEIKALVYSQTWPLLSLWLKAESKENSKTDQTLFTPSTETIDQVRQNMLGDCFASIAMQLGDNQNIATLLQKRRAQKTLTAQHKNIPEQAPFAITFDAVKLVIRYAQEQSRDHGIFEMALNATSEVSEVFDNVALEKWMEFARKCQEMIWTGRSVTETLGAATYSTDDAHIRSYASILAELLNQDVSPLKPGSGYNPFANQTSAEEAHLKIAEQIFPEIIDHVLVEEKPEILLQKAQEQNDKIMSGKIIGWCVPALIETYRAYKPDEPDAAKLAEHLNAVFFAKLRNIKWSEIRKLHTMIMVVKRDNKDADLQNLKERLEKSETLSQFSKYFE